MFDPRELETPLHAGEVDYVIIGGLAVAAHGYVRATKDLDIVPSPEAANLDHSARVLRSLDGELYGIGDFDAAEFPFDRLDPAQLAEGGNFVLATRHGRLYLMQRVPGIDADQAYSVLRPAAIRSELGGVAVFVCSREHLVAMKRAAGRQRDLDDLRELGAE
ncbi:MAG TPA: hypothetical protein VFR49_15985 [Solirubrobacteraceae bacterium]|nr:hypothetical protein [Solirubrobacteraceae bacterium]